MNESGFWLSFRFTHFLFPDRYSASDGLLRSQVPVRVHALLPKCDEQDCEDRPGKGTVIIDCWEVRHAIIDRFEGIEQPNINIKVR